MKKGKICSKLKKILITIMCVIALVFSMPVKAKANIIEDFIDLLLRIPDGIMWVGNWWIADRDTHDSMAQIGLKGVHGTPWGKDDDGYIYNFFVTPYDIFTAGETREYLDLYGDKHIYRNLPIFSANFFDIDNGVVAENDATALRSNEVLRPVIGNIYKYLRNLAIVLMMLVLLYIGIKIIISSAASDQSKYKKMLMDWLVGLCLLFIMHYIMSFIMNFNDIVVKMLSNSESSSYYISFGALGDSAVASNGIGEEWYEFFDDYNDKTFISLHLDLKGTASSGQRWQSIEPSNVAFDFNSNDATIQLNTHTDWGDSGLVKINARITGDSTNDVCIYRGNLVEYIRTLMSYSQSFITIYANNTNTGKVATEDNSDSDIMAKMGYGILYLALVVETVMFCVIYFKRVLQLAFLTMIAPIVAFMYPLDKIGDGSAQSFNGWLKDYIFNALLQPLHLLLYTIFITAAMDLFSKNIIYALAVYAFMIPAEKYFKKIFGFDKASGSPPGGMAGAIGGPLAMRGFDKLTGLGPHGPKGGPGGSGNNSKNGVKVKKKKLGNSNSNSGGSGPAPASSGSGSIGGSGSGSGSGLRTSSANNSGQRGNRPSPTAGTDGKKSLLRRGGGLVGNMVKRPIARAITGGKYDHFKNTGPGFLKAVAGNAGRRTARLALTAGIAGAGVMAGAATAMATGDVNNLFKGAATGIATGWNRGKQLSDWGADKVGGFIANRSADLANDSKENGDSGYFNKYRYNQAMDAFKDQELTDDQKEILKTYSPYVDFDGNMDLLKAYVAADASEETLTGDDKIKSVVGTVSDAQRFGDLSKESNRQAFINAHMDEIGDVDENSIKEGISSDDIEQRAKQNQEASLAENKSKEQNMNRELDSRKSDIRKREREIKKALEEAGETRDREETDRLIAEQNRLKDDREDIERQRRDKTAELRREREALQNLDNDKARAELENEAIAAARQAKQEGAMDEINRKLRNALTAQEEIRKNSY